MLGIMIYSQKFNSEQESFGNPRANLKIKWLYYIFSSFLANYLRNDPSK